MAAATQQQEHRFTHRVVVITPEIASEWLEKNVSNRTVTQSKVEEYARDMRMGRWHLTGDPISFDWDGNLINGQHRLWACITADAEFTTTVVRGVDPEAKIVIDTGKKRALGDFLQMQGMPNGKHLAAMINLCYRWDQEQGSKGGQLGRDYPTHEEAVAWFERNRGIAESALFGMQIYREIKLSASAIGAAHYLNARVDGEAADEFWEGVRTGVGLDGGDVRIALRRWVMSTLARRDKTTTEVLFFYYLKAMQLWRDGKTARILSIKNGERPQVWKA